MWPPRIIVLAQTNLPNSNTFLHSILGYQYQIFWLQGYEHEIFDRDYLNGSLEHLDDNISIKWPSIRLDFVHQSLWYVALPSLWLSVKIDRIPQLQLSWYSMPSASLKSSAIESYQLSSILSWPLFLLRSFFFWRIRNQKQHCASPSNTWVLLENFSCLKLSVGARECNVHGFSIRIHNWTPNLVTSEIVNGT